MEYENTIKFAWYCSDRIMRGMRRLPRVRKYIWRKWAERRHICDNGNDLHDPGRCMKSFKQLENCRHLRPAPNRHMLPTLRKKMEQEGSFLFFYLFRIDFVYLEKSEMKAGGAERGEFGGSTYGPFVSLTSTTCWSDGIISEAIYTHLIAMVRRRMKRNMMCCDAACGFIVCSTSTLSARMYSSVRKKIKQATSYPTQTPRSYRMPAKSHPFICLNHKSSCDFIFFIYLLSIS